MTEAARIDQLAATWWDDRSAAALASSTTSLVRGLVEIGDVFATWYVPMASRKRSLANPYDPASEPSVVQAMATDDPMLHGLFHFGLWNGLDDKRSVALTVLGQVRVSNETSPARAFLRVSADVSPDMLEAALRALIGAFDPDVAGAMVGGNMGRLTTGHVPGPLLYVARRGFAISPADHVMVVNLKDGWLLRAGPWSTRMEPATLASAIDSLERSLEKIDPT